MPVSFLNGYVLLCRAWNWLANKPTIPSIPRANYNLLAEHQHICSTIWAWKSEQSHPSIHPSIYPGHGIFQRKLLTCLYIWPCLIPLVIRKVVTTDHCPLGVPQGLGPHGPRRHTRAHKGPGGPMRAPAHNGPRGPTRALPTRGSASA